MSGQTIYKSIRNVSARRRSSRDYPDLPNGVSDESDAKLIKDTAHPSELVRIWMWLPGLLLVLFMACFVMRVQYDMPIAEVLLALFLAFFFSFLAIQSSGATGTNPTHWLEMLCTDIFRHHAPDGCFQSLSDHPWVHDIRSRMDNSAGSKTEPARRGSGLNRSKSSIRLDWRLPRWLLIENVATVAMACTINRDTTSNLHRAICLRSFRNRISVYPGSLASHLPVWCTECERLASSRDCCDRSSLQYSTLEQSLLPHIRYFWLSHGPHQTAVVDRKVSIDESLSSQHDDHIFGVPDTTERLWYCDAYRSHHCGYLAQI